MKFVHGIAAADASWYSMNKLETGIPSVPVTAGDIRGEKSLHVSIHWRCASLKEWIIQILEQKKWMD